MSIPAGRAAVSALVFTGFCGVVVGCSSSLTKDSLAPTVAGSAEQFDACTLIPSADIQHLLGTAIPGRPNSSLVSECVWKDDTTQNSVTLHIGNADTAPDNKLADHSDIGMPSDMMG